MLAVGGPIGSGVARAAEPPALQAPQISATSSLDAFAARVELTKKSLPAITRVATAAATQILQHPGALIDVPYFEQQTFAEEILNRAGGLAQALPTVERPQMATPHDIILLSVRSWEQDGEKIGKLMREAHEKGWTIFLFASRAGMPPQLKADYLIDNGAAGGGQTEAPTNALTNVLNGWVWTCEYTAALTRGGRYPGILASILSPGSEEHNKKLQTPAGRPFLGVAPTKIAAGELGSIYLRRVDALLSSLGGAWTQEQINRAAGLIAEQLNAGKTVGIATCTHFLLQEIFENRRTPMKPFNVVWHSKTAFKENLKPGDMVVWFGYVGVSTPYEDYEGAMRDAGLKLIGSFVPDADPANNAPGALSFITQHWTPPDAEVPLPFPPGHMAPVSGLDEGLLYRLLEDAVLARLHEPQKPA
jgi:uncharacterized phosphosugar-binding protein